MASVKNTSGLYDALAFIDTPQHIFAAINSERSYVDSETGELGILVTFALMTEQMLEKQRELHAWADAGAQHNSAPEFTPYLFAFDTFISDNNQQLQNRYLELRERTDESNHPLPDYDFETGTDVVILNDSQYFSCTLSSAQSIESSDSFLELKGIVGLSSESYYVGDAILSIENPNKLAFLDPSITSPISLQSSSSRGGTAPPNGPTSPNGSNPSDIDRLIYDFLSEFDSPSPDDNRMIARIYYVGQANLIVAGCAEPVSQQSQYHHRISNPAVFIDIGEPRPAIWSQMTDSDKDCVQQNLDEVKNIEAKYAFITHWDEDHYNAAYDLLNDPEGSFDPDIWFLPTIKQSSHGASTLISELVRRNKKLIPMDQATLPMYYPATPDAKSTALHRGTGAAKNPGSYILKLGNTIFPGDCLYRFFPQELLDQVSNTLINLVVPHHGSKLIKGDEKKLDTVRSKNGTAIVSVGNILNSGRRPYSKRRKDGTYSAGHPDSAHLEYLAQRNFNVGCTYGLANTGYRYKKLYLN